MQDVKFLAAIKLVSTSNIINLECVSIYIYIYIFFYEIRGVPQEEGAGVMPLIN